MNKKIFLFLIIPAQTFIIQTSQLDLNPQDQKENQLSVVTLPRILSDIGIRQEVDELGNGKPVVVVVIPVGQSQMSELEEQEVRNKIFCCFCCVKPCCESRQDECCDETWCCPDWISRCCRLFCMA